MFLEDDEKEPRKAALKELVGKMGESTLSRLKSMKKGPSKWDPESPSEGQEEADGFAGKGMEGMDEDEPSDAEKLQISKLYHKYCK